MGFTAKKYKVLVSFRHKNVVFLVKLKANTFAF
jgi:hypothetical protein